MSENALAILKVSSDSRRLIGQITISGGLPRGTIFSCEFVLSAIFHFARVPCVKRSRPFGSVVESSDLILFLSFRSLAPHSNSGTIFLMSFGVVAGLRSSFPRYERTIPLFHAIFHAIFIFPPCQIQHLRSSGSALCSAGTTARPPCEFASFHLSFSNYFRSSSFGLFSHFLPGLFLHAFVAFPRFVGCWRFEISL